MKDPIQKWRRAYAELQARLLASGALDLSSLSALRADSSHADTAAWLRQEGSRVLAVDREDSTFYPRFQFTEAGDLRTELARHIATLQESGAPPWRIWAWLTEPAALVSGEVPVEVLVENPARGMRAVERFAVVASTETDPRAAVDLERDS